MKRLLRLWIAENKRAWIIFPKMLLQAVVLTLVVGTTAFCATKLLYQDDGLTIRVAVVMEEENQLTEFALDYVKQTEEEVEFVVTESEDALNGVERGEYAAAIILAPQLIEGILNGENPPVLVVCNESFSMAGGLIKELTKAGAGMLSVAQAEIYAMYELATEYDVKGSLLDLQNAINTDNLNVAMNRISFFDYEEVSATGSFSVKTYYISAAVVAVFLFFGMPLGMYLQQESQIRLLQYKRFGIGGMKQQAVCWLVLFGIYGVLALLGGIGVSCGMGMDSVSVGSVVVIWLAAGSIAAFVLFVYEMVEKKSSAIFLLAFLTVILLFLGGGIIPKVFFPEGLAENVEWLPSGHWISCVGAALEGEVAGKALGISMLYGSAFFVAAVGLRCRRLNGNG